jgi:hypothetical protein
VKVRPLKTARNTTLAEDEFISRRNKGKFRALIVKYSKAVEWSERRVIIMGSIDN